MQTHNITLTYSMCACAPVFMCMCVHAHKFIPQVIRSAEHSINGKQLYIELMIPGIRIAVLYMWRIKGFGLTECISQNCRAHLHKFVPQYPHSLPVGGS